MNYDIQCVQKFMQIWLLEKHLSWITCTVTKSSWNSCHFLYIHLAIYTKFPCKTHEEVDFYPKNLAMIDSELYTKWRTVITKMWTMYVSFFSSIGNSYLLENCTMWWQHFLLGINLHHYFTVKNINLNKIYNKIINIYQYDINYCIQLISKYTDLKFT